jgi:hypothetical protein
MTSLTGVRVPPAPKFGQQASVAGKVEMEEIVKWGRQLQKTLELYQTALIELQTENVALTARITALEP